MVGVVGFEPTTTHVQDEYADQAALHPEFQALKNPLTSQSEGSHEFFFRHTVIPSDCSAIRGELGGKLISCADNN